MAIDRDSDRGGNWLPAAILTLGAGVALTVAGALGIEQVRMFVPAEPEPEDSTSVTFAGDGEACISKSHRYFENGSWHYKVEATLPDGRLLDLQALGEATVQASYLFSKPMVELRTRQSWGDRVMAVQGGQRDEAWFWVVDLSPEARGYLVCYSRRSNLPLGYLTTAGFQRDLPRPDVMFPAHGTFIMQRTSYQVAGLPSNETANFWITSENAAFELDLVKRSARELDLEGATVRFAAAGEAQWPEGDRAWLAVRSDDAIYFFDRGGNKRVLHLTPELAALETLNVTERRDGGFSIIGYDQPEDLELAHDVLVTTADAQGNPGNPIRVSLPQQTIHWAIDDYATAAFCCAGPGWPIARDVLDILRYGQPVWWTMIAVGALVNDYRFWLTFVSGAVIAAICYRRQVRYQVPMRERIGWTAFVFLLGIPGWIGYRYCRGWPPLEECPACHRPVPRTGEECVACHGEFPLPTAKGTEIFA